jgi:hypothetical protein
MLPARGEGRLCQKKKAVKDPEVWVILIKMQLVAFLATT